jgi:spore germination cell wall hydrolase CwlJ-like protein
VNDVFEIALIALTVWGEARGEDYAGKLAVAYVIKNRMTRRQVKVSRVVLAPWQFSFWNTEDPSRSRISEIDEFSDVWQDCLRAAASAYLATDPDPTNGAEYYMNVDVVRRQRGGTLPLWWRSDTDPDTEVKIGSHTFRRRNS